MQSGVGEVIASWLEAKAEGVLAGLRIGGLTLVRRTSIRFNPNLGVLANRANTKGSVLLKSVGLTLNGGVAGRVVHRKTSSTLMRLVFRVRGRTMESGLGDLRIRYPRSRLVVAEGLSNKQDIDHVGKRDYAVTELERMSSVLLSVRKRRSRRSLLCGSGRLRVLSSFNQRGLGRLLPRARRG